MPGPTQRLDRFVGARAGGRRTSRRGGCWSGRGPRGRDRPLRPLQDAHRALPLQAVVRPHGRRRGRASSAGAAPRASSDAPGLAQAAIDAVERRLDSHTGRKLTFHPDPDALRQHLPELARGEARLVHQPPALVGPPHPGLAGRLRGCRRAWRTAPGRDCPRRREDRACWVPHRPRQTAPRCGASAVAHWTGHAAACEVHGLPAGRGGGGNARGARWKRPGLDAGPGRARHLVLLGPVALSHPRLARPGDAPGSTRARPRSAAVEGGRTPSSYYYPGSCLVTARDIITLWVARMVVMGLYNLGDVPFTDCFIHANILDGKGERMSQDPRATASTRWTSSSGTAPTPCATCSATMQTGTQDIRLPVQAISPFTGEPWSTWPTRSTGARIFTYLCTRCRQGVRRARHHAGRARGQDHQRPLRGRPQLLQQALERGALRAA